MHLSPLKSSHPCAGETTGSPQYTYFLRLTAVKYVDPKHFSRPLEYPPLSIVLVKVKCQSEVLAHVPYLNMDPALTVLSFRVLLTRLIRLLSAAASLTALLFLLILSLFLLLLARRELIPWHTFSILLLFFFHDLLHITKHLLKVISCRLLDFTPLRRRPSALALHDRGTIGRNSGSRRRAQER